MGQALMQLPQRIHGPGAGRAAAAGPKATSALFCFSTGKAGSATAVPIIGPPIRILETSSFTPQKSSTSPMGVPMTTSTFFASPMASPSTVRRLVVRGMPVARYLPSVDTVVTFSTITPASAGRPPRGTSRPVVFSMSTFSAPWG